MTTAATTTFSKEEDYNNSTETCLHNDVDIVTVRNKGDHLRLEILCNLCKKQGIDVYEVDVESIVFTNQLDDV